MGGERARLLLGVGNPLRGDDGVGPFVATRVARSWPEAVKVRLLSGEGVELLSSWEGSADVIVVDAVRSGAPPGTLHRFEAHRQALPASFFSYSTHAFSLAEAVELGRVLGKLPERLIVYGIEGSDFRVGAAVTDAVSEAAEVVIAQIGAELADGRPGPEEATR